VVQYKVNFFEENTKGFNNNLKIDRTDDLQDTTV